ncbi:uncharacterized protein TM35_000015830 [Trypanosoma theileri]|uniref:Uncharacterized protein n=1 Tax=Trypanosoma theileri TaxID=67003 RepID=A0A1X0P9W4_9TRYP|nr:uncharacterized protein TM35_000015830 [Trypanosoma theileri]ORC93706.1 hypothetical protein TM35_000015830 [Trypanosoma theileri]
MSGRNPTPEGSAEERVWSENSPVQAAGNQAACVDPVAPPAAEEELAAEAIIRVDGPCENLPQLRPHELKIIGRCVTFQGETIVDGERVLLYYEGLVGMITKDTVMLLHVNRFTNEDFQKYQEKLLKAAQEQTRRRRNQEENADYNQGNGGQNTQESQGGEDALEAGENTSGSSNDNEMSGISCFLPGGQESREVREETSAVDVYSQRHGRQLGSGTLGPVPFMTFSRRRIHGVVFGRDPHSSFYSLFRDPSKRHFDMQCLRMFVRRYLVHSSQGNNPRSINLRPFVAWRCNCKDIDNELLLDVAKEELAHLVKTEREIVKYAERAANNRRSILQFYQPPPGLFSGTGILFLTRIPVQTFCLAIIELLVTLMLLGFSAYSFVAAPNGIVDGYIRDYTFPVTFAGIASLFASGLTAFHSLKMRLPLTVTLYGTLRIVTATIGIGLNMMVLILVGGAVSFTHIRSYLNRIAVISSELCVYYAQHNCSGFGEVCDPANTAPLCMWDTCPILRENTCTQPLSASFTRVFIPIVVLSMVLVVLFLIDHFMHFRLVQISRQLLAQL